MHSSGTSAGKLRCSGSFLAQQRVSHARHIQYHVERETLMITFMVQGTELVPPHLLSAPTSLVN